MPTQDGVIVEHSNGKQHIEDKKLDESDLDFASMKIIELSKKVRELTARLSSEQNKSLNLSKQLKSLECKLKNSNETPDLVGSHKIPSPTSVSSNFRNERKLKRAENMINELRIQLHSANNELRLAKKALEFETGECIENLSLWLAKVKVEKGLDNLNNAKHNRKTNVIAALKCRIRILETQLNTACPQLTFHEPDFNRNSSNVPSEFSGATSLGVDLFECSENAYKFNQLMVTDNNSVVSNKPNLLELETGKKQLEEELNMSKINLGKTKARLNTLSQELKRLKQQTILLVQKGLNDDKLVDSLLQHNANVKSILETEQSKRKSIEDELVSQKNEFQSFAAQKQTEISDLKRIIEGKEEKIKLLEAELSHLRDVEKNVNQVFSQLDTTSVVETTNTNSIYLNYDAIQNGDLTKRVAGLITERDGLKKVIENMEKRFNEVLDKKEALEQQFEKLVRQRHAEVNKYEPIRPKLPIKNRQPVLRNVQDCQDNNTYLLSAEYVDHILNNCGLTASGTKIVKQRMHQLQSALREALDKIKSLQFRLDTLSAARSEDFNILSHIVKDVREKCAVGKTNEA